MKGSPRSTVSQLLLIEPANMEAALNRMVQHDSMPVTWASLRCPRPQNPATLSFVSKPIGEFSARLIAVLVKMKLGVWESVKGIWLNFSGHRRICIGYLGEG